MENSDKPVAYVTMPEAYGIDAIKQMQDFFDSQADKIPHRLVMVPGPVCFPPAQHHFIAATFEESGDAAADFAKALMADKP